jgi:hypothetical protein
MAPSDGGGGFEVALPLIFILLCFRTGTANSQQRVIILKTVGRDNDLERNDTAPSARQVRITRARRGLSFVKAEVTEGRLIMFLTNERAWTKRGRKINPRLRSAGTWRSRAVRSYNCHR